LLQRLALLELPLIRTLKRLAFPATDDLLEETFRPVAGDLALR
jgi:hypothetical protein